MGGLLVGAGFDECALAAALCRMCILVIAGGLSPMTRQAILFEEFPCEV